MTKDRQREISLDDALAAVSFKLDGNFGGKKKEKKKKCRAFMKNTFFALSQPSKFKSYSKCIKYKCVCVFLKTCFQPMFLMCLYFCSLTCRSLEEKQTLHRVAV